MICHATRNLHRHHVFPGSNRQRSEKHGMCVWLCFDHHTGDHGVHNDPALDKMIRAWAQTQFEKTHTREEFIKIFRRSYL